MPGERWHTSQARALDLVKLTKGPLRDVKPANAVSPTAVILREVIDIELFKRSSIPMFSEASWNGDVLLGSMFLRL